MNYYGNDKTTFTQLESLLQKDDLRAAQELLNILFKSIPGDPELYKYAGWILFKQEKLEQAEKFFLKAYQKCSENPDYTYNLGWINFYQSKLQEAEEYYLKTIELAPEFYLPYVNMGAIKYETQSFQEALEYYTKARALASEDTHLINNIGDVYTKLNDYDNAIKTYGDVIKLDPENARAYGNLSSVYQYIGKTAEAEQLCLKALDINPESVNGHYNLANIYLEQARYQESLTEILKAKDLSKHPSEPVLECLLRVKEKLGLDTSDELYFIEQIQKKDPLIDHIVKKNHYKVIDILLERLKTDPNNYYCLTQLAYTLSQLGRYVEAVDVYKYCILLDDSDPWVCQHYAFALTRINRKREAILYFTRAIELNPSLVWARKQLAEVYLELNMQEKAEKIINETIEITAEEEQILLGSLFSLKGRALESTTPEEALDWYMLAVRYNEFESYNYERIASLLAIDYVDDVNRLLEVEEYLNSNETNLAIRYCQQAIGEFRLGNTKQSIKFYKNSLEEDIMYYPAYVGVSQALYEKKYGAIKPVFTNELMPLLKEYVINWDSLTFLEQHIINLSTYPFKEKLKNLVDNKYSITIVPVDTKLTAYPEQKHLAGVNYIDGTKYDGIRATGGKAAYIGVERLRDLLWIIPSWLLQAPATFAHEFAHHIHDNEPEKVLQKIENSYKECINHKWPFITDYAKTNEQEYFSENYCQLVRNQLHNPKKPINIDFSEFI